MSEHGERLWPDESEQPSCEITSEDRTFILTWDNTMVVYYRTGDAQYDELLERYNHVVHRFFDDEENDFTTIWIVQDVLGEECMDYLLDKMHPYVEKPKVDQYILDHLVERAMERLPDSIGPDFGTTD